MLALLESSCASVQLCRLLLSYHPCQVWFWRFKPDARREVEARRPAVDAARADVEAVVARRDALWKRAKGELGLWSEAGVEEGRELFRESFASGKLFAQQRSFFDALFTILGSRDRDWLSLLLQLLFQARRWCGVC